jgi:hypothetical protein
MDVAAAENAADVLATCGSWIAVLPSLLMSKLANLRLYRVSGRCKTIVAPVTHISPPTGKTDH